MQKFFKPVVFLLSGLLALALSPAVSIACAFATQNGSDQNSSGALVGTSDVESAQIAATEKLETVASKRLEGGGYAYTLGTEDGDEEENIVCLIPPKGFNPLEASADELEEYGFPERPEGGDALADWKDAMSSWKEAATPDAEVTNQLPSQSATVDGEAPVANQFSASAINSSSAVVKTGMSDNWSGFVAAGPEKTYRGVYGTFTQPKVSATSSASYSCYWVGLGGYWNKRLVQCGTSANYYPSKKKAAYSAWYEWLSPSEDKTKTVAMQDFSLSVKPGNKIYSKCTWNPTDKVVKFYVENKTTGKSASYKKKISKVGNYYDGMTAEWITERPTIKNMKTPLAKYGECNWTGCHVKATKDTKAGKYSMYDVKEVDRYRVDMAATGSDKILSKTSKLLDSSSFATTWKASR